MVCITDSIGKIRPAIYKGLLSSVIILNMTLVLQSVVLNAVTSYRLQDTGNW